MARGTSAQRDTDGLAFPMRVEVIVPPHGLGAELDRIAAWLRERLPSGDDAQHGAGTLGGDGVGFYVRRIEDATAFPAAFPLFEPADATISRAYRSPLFPAAVLPPKPPGERC